jgi:hypothetical protein
MNLLENTHHLKLSSCCAPMRPCMLPTKMGDHISPEKDRSSENGNPNLQRGWERERERVKMWGRLRACVATRNALTQFTEKVAQKHSWGVWLNLDKTRDALKHR